MALIGSVEITNHILRLYGGGDADILLEDGDQTWAIEPDEDHTHQIYKIVVEQLARQGYRIVDISDGCTTLQLDAREVKEDAGLTAAFRMEHLESVALATDTATTDVQFFAAHGLVGMRPNVATNGVALIRSNQKIRLIKWLRLVKPGLGLKEAKELADRMMAAQGVSPHGSGCGAAVLVPFIVGGVGAALGHFFGIFK